MSTALTWCPEARRAEISTREIVDLPQPPFPDATTIFMVGIVLAISVMSVQHESPALFTLTPP
jgi:hypothetical protein